MRTFGTFLAVGILALAAGCGGSSDNTTNTTTNTATTTATTTVTASTTSTSTSTGTCNAPSCLANLATTCEPSGTCVEQTDATGTTYFCYSNGVKEIQTVNLTSRTAVVTYKQGSATCYSAEAGLDTGSITFKNASGATIATGTVDSSGATTITCTGGQPVTLNSACNDTSSCTPGVCTADGSTSTATVTATNTTTSTTTATSTATGTNCAALSACCPSIAAAEGITALQCQNTFAGFTDATCASTLTGVKAAGLCP